MTFIIGSHQLTAWKLHSTKLTCKYSRQWQNENKTVVFSSPSYLTRPGLWLPLAWCPVWKGGGSKTLLSNVFLPVPEFISRAGIANSTIRIGFVMKWYEWNDWFWKKTAPICTILSDFYLGSYPRLHSILRQKHLLSKKPPTILCSQSRSLTEILERILQPREIGNPSEMSS